MTFSDFEKMERICSILLEKLDKSVFVGTPEFYHSAECLSQMRYEKKRHNRTSLLFSLNGVTVTSLCVLQAACVCVCSRECSAEGQQSQSAPGTKSGTPSAG